MSTIRVSTLSLPLEKANEFRCSICSQTGTLLCASCKCTPYCSEEHFNDDSAIHKLICPLVAQLTAVEHASTVGIPDSSVLSANGEEITIVRKREIDRLRNEILRIVTTEAQRALSHGDPEAAIPPALHALHYGQLIYGNSVQVATYHLLLGEAALRLGSGRLPAAEKHIAHARAIVLAAIEREEGLSKEEQQSVRTLRGKLHQQAVNLFLCKGNLLAAQKEVTLYAYHTALATGPDSLDSSLALNLISQVFQTAADNRYGEYTPRRRHNVAGLCSVSARVRLLHLWWKFFVSIGAAPEELPPASVDTPIPELVFSTPTSEQDTPCMSPDVIVEAPDILPYVFYGFQCRDGSKTTSFDSVLAGACCALFYEYQGNMKEAKQLATCIIDKLVEPNGFCSPDAIYDDFYLRYQPAPHAVLAAMRRLDERPFDGAE